MPRLPSVTRTSVVPLALVAGAAAAVLAPGPPVTVRASTAHAVDLRSTVTMGGELVPAVSYRLSFGSTVAATDPADLAGAADCPAGRAGVALGPVVTLTVSPGSTVTRGQPLARADSAAASAALASAQQDLTRAQALLEQDRAAAARPPAAGSGTPPTPAPLPPGALEGADLDRVQRDQDRIDALQHLVDGAQITAPADGVVQEVDVVPGTVPDCRTTAVLLRSRELRVQADANVEQRGRLQIGQSAMVVLPGEAGRSAGAVLTLPVTAAPGVAVGPGPGSVPGSVAGAAWAQSSGDAAAPLRQSYPLGLSLADPPPDALPGMAATVTVTLTEHLNVLAVPSAAIRHDRNGTHVNRRVCAHGAHDRSCHTISTPVQAGASADQLTEIVSGLHRGDTVLLPG